ncbi:von Willebrand factor type A domain protein [Rubripirellula amarantea]|uniref:von Willebrand factor type A domain protein n=1 Tax=Rubripirellula amarantea TaxID=2527999 RepID=A0A5C5WEP0_9BACT|nr:VWA domain-containing protein [Rubripirellula amarantea]TWT49100.1 von Willebrand factor type A domain protein [Rubripirellula amarantea]
MSLFLHPWYLLLLLLIPLLIWLRKRTRVAAIEYSSVVEGVEFPRTLRQRLAWLPTALSLIAMTLLIISLARPRQGKERTVYSSEGIAMELVVDRSGSMMALDFMVEGSRVDRLTAVKKVASEFVLGDEDDETMSGRTSDRIGLVAFAGYADAITPPTLDHSFLVKSLNRTQIAHQSEDGTAIGDALALATEKLNSLKSKTDAEVKSKVIILLTDGENTAGELDPEAAAELAKTLGIKVYTIGVGTKGRAPFPVRRNRLGEIMVDYIEVNIDEETLTSIANLTGGKYFRATDTDSLKQIYAEIDELERTEFETDRFVDYREWAVTTFTFRGWRIPGLVAIASLCMALSLALSQTVFRRLA